MRAFPSVAFGIELRMVASEDGGRSPIVVGQAHVGAPSYRANWSLPGGTRQYGAPVFGFSQASVGPGEIVNAVIVPVIEESVAEWRTRVRLGAELRMLEGGRLCGAATVLSVDEVSVPLSDGDVRFIKRWLGRSS